LNIPRLWRAFAAVSGVLHALILAFAVSIGGSAAALVTPDDPATTIAEALIDNTGNVVTGNYLLLIAAFFLIVFVGYLRSAVVDADGDQWPAAVAFGGGMVAAGVLTIVALIGISQGAINDYGSDPAVARTLLTLGWNGMWMTAPGLAALTGGVSLLTLTFGTLPRSIGWLGSAVAVVLLTPFWGIGFAGALLWIVAVSVTLVARELRSTEED
jgi:hypothetical protein